MKTISAGTNHPNGSIIIGAGTGPSSTLIAIGGKACGPIYRLPDILTPHCTSRITPTQRGRTGRTRTATGGKLGAAGRRRTPTSVSTNISFSCALSIQCDFEGGVRIRAAEESICILLEQNECAISRTHPESVAGAQRGVTRVTGLQDRECRTQAKLPR